MEAADTPGMSRVRGIRCLVVLMALAAVAGCSGSGNRSARAPLTERQRDSVLARTSLPGASTVGRAMDVSDDQARRSAAANAQVDSLPR